MAINVSTNFNLGAELPLDIRTKVATKADLGVGFAIYKGLQTYVEDEDAVYQYDGSAWNEIATAVAASSTNGYIKVNGTDVKVYTHPTTAGNKHLPTGGTAGQALINSASGTGVWKTLEISDVSGLSDELAGLLSEADAMVFKGVITTAADFLKVWQSDKNFQAGWTWKFGAAFETGQLWSSPSDSVAVEPGDMIIAVKDFEENFNGGIGNYFTVIQANIDGAVTSSAASAGSGNVAVFDGTTGKIIKDSGLSTDDLYVKFESGEGDTTSVGATKLVFDQNATDDVVYNALPDLGSDGEAHIKFSTKYTNSTPMVTALGGLAAGTTFAGMSLKELLDKLLYPYTKPTVTLTATANGAGVYELGTTVSPTFTVTTVKKSDSITSLGLYSGSTLLASNVTVQAAGGTQTGVTLNTALSATTTVTAKVGDGTSTVTSSGITYTFADPYYYGVVASAPTTSAEIKALTKLVQSKGTKTVTHTTTADKGRYCFAYPASYGNIAKVLDGNGFDNTEDFTKSTVSVTNAAGSSVSYNVYTYNNTVTAGSMSMTYSY